MHDKDRQYLRQLVQRKSNEDDKDALNALGSMCVDEVVRLRDPSYVARAEENFTMAAKAGNASAARYLERVWPLEKPELLRRIQDPIA